ncbi:C40 family peptidase [Kitasatospora sp. NPDC096147]|uniref:C40 family peptidase n=1 Tax=Kitasatospora sp. NPDC096147 TaxID=3364093 RepID=UPI0037F6EDBC
MTRRLLPTLVLTLAGLLGLLPAAVAAPDPYPSTEDIAAARADEASAQADTAAIEASLTTAQNDLERAGREAEQAVEAYNGAQAHLKRARAEAATRAAQAATAEAARAEAAETAAALAAETYRQGGAGPQLSAIDALLGARGPAAAGRQAAAVGVIGATTKAILDAATSTAAEAARTAEAARGAEEDAGRAADAVHLARIAAESRLASQQTQVTEIAARREQLLTALAAARNTTLELERQRREALEAIAAEQAAAAARAAEEAAAREAAAAAAAAEAEAAAKAKATKPAPSSSPSSSSSSSDSYAADTPWSADGAAAAIAFARSKIGLPYIWGGEGPAGYDCSGLTMMAWRKGGKSLTHFAADQYAESTPVSYAQLRPGDLVFWTDTGRARDIHHVAIYIGDDQMIEAPRPGTVIKQASLWIMGRPDFYGRP